MCNDINSNFNNEKSIVTKEKDVVVLNDNKPKTGKSIESSEESEDEEDVRDLEGRTVSAKGHEVKWFTLIINALSKFVWFFFYVYADWSS